MAKNSAQGIQKTVTTLLKDLSPRNRDIISRRFGLKAGKKETLESIGASYNITRERVRQIEETSLDQLKKSAQENKDIYSYISLAKDILNEHGGILKEQELFKAFSGRDGESVVNSSLAFLLTLSPELARSPENDNFHPFWAAGEATLAAFRNTTDSLIKLLEKINRSVPEKDFYFMVEKYNVPGFINHSKTISDRELGIVMAISKDLDKNIFGEVGLARWPEIRPKGVRDKAYLVLKKEQSPRHFSEIAKLININVFGGKKANVQTVHNELIKDPRFVLVGRGMYALSEWGYKAGTVKDVLVDILKAANKPLPKAALMAKVRDARMVKENTILLNLQDSKTFIRHEDGTYELRNG